MKKILIITSLLITATINSQTVKDIWKQTKDEVKKEEKEVENKAKEEVHSAVGGTTAPALSNEDVIKGLREALSVGTNSSTSVASQLDGYYKNPRLFIPWPEEAKDMKDKLMKLGFEKKIEEFETSLNRAAEEAAKKAGSVFLDAITKMSVSDGFAILKGADTAATNYLRKNSYAGLYSQFIPIVKEAIAKVKVTSYWNPLVTKYNKLPGVKKQNPNLDDYVTKKAANGLFVLIADEEAKIRKDPAARVTDLLKKVFGAK
ncbi:MAG TPA: DUF4197 domain-containing protein [Bacteroidia bacterium]|nr:DUF4197 domain-containing protein [Bacteroidia bacterium]